MILNLALVASAASSMMTCYGERITPQISEMIEFVAYADRTQPVDSLSDMTLEVRREYGEYYKDESTADVFKQDRVLPVAASEAPRKPGMIRWDLGADGWTDLRLDTPVGFQTVALGRPFSAFLLRTGHDDLPTIAMTCRWTQRQ